MKNTTKLLILMLLLYTNATIGQDGNSYSLAQAEEFALSHNEKVKNASLDITAAEKKIFETTAIGLPQINVEGQFQQLLDIPVTVVDATLFNPNAPEGSIAEFQMGQEFTANASLAVNQLLFDGSYIVGLQFSKFYKKMSETALNKTKLDVKMMVKEAYYNVLIAQKNVDLLDSIAVTTKTLWEQSQIYFDNGFMLQEEIDQFELAYNRIEQSQINAVNQLDIAKNMLKLQMGVDLNEEISLTDSFEDLLEEIETNNPALMSFSVTNNFDYIMLNQQKTLNEYSLKNEKAAYLPSAYAFFNHSQNAFRNEFDFFEDKPWYPTTVWGLGVKVPITSSGQRIMKVQQAEIKIEQGENNLAQVEKALKFQELQLKAMFINAYEKMHIEEKNVTLAHSIYDKSIARKNEGAVSALDVTQKQSQLLQAQGNYIGAIMEMLTYKVQLDKLINK